MDLTLGKTTPAAVYLDCSYSVIYLAFKFKQIEDQGLVHMGNTLSTYTLHFRTQKNVHFEKIYT